MVPDSQRWVLVNGRYHANPNYVRPWWDYGLEGAIAAGPLLGAAVAGISILPEAMAASRVFGLSSSRFGNSFYRARAGLSGQGSWNHGSWRIGWSYNAANGRVYFQPRIGNSHLPTPIFIQAP